MKRFLFGVLLTSLVSLAADASDKSPLTGQYAAKFDHAVELLDGYRGNTSDLEVALTELSEVLNVYPRHAPSYREMARYSLMRGDNSSLPFSTGSMGAADAFVKKAIEINPNYAEAFVLRGHLFRLMDRHEDALAALRKAEALGTTDPWLQNNWADLLLDEGKFEEAARRYRKVIASETGNKKAMAAAIEGLVRYYTNVGNLDQADLMYRKGIEFEPKSAWGYGNYAQFLLCQRDDYESSIARSRQALSLMSYGVGRYWLAAALYRKWAAEFTSGGTSAKGREYFLEAQAIYPDATQIARDANECPPLRRITEALVRSKAGTSR